MALNISRICDSQDRHQGRANKGTLNTESAFLLQRSLSQPFPWPFLMQEADLKWLQKSWQQGVLCILGKFTWCCWVSVLFFFF